MAKAGQNAGGVSLGATNANMMGIVLVSSLKIRVFSGTVPSAHSTIVFTGSTTQKLEINAIRLSDFAGCAHAATGHAAAPPSAARKSRRGTSIPRAS